MNRTIARLADGRELIYFDDTANAKRDVVDRRPLPSCDGESHLRRDRVHDEWVVMAAHRQTRTHLPAADECPLCPSDADRLSEVPGDYDVVVFENRFPSLRGTSATVDSAARGRPAAVGRCEVVSFSPDHKSTFAQLGAARIQTVYEAWIDRTCALSALPGVEYVFVFENRGEEIGVTLHHPHGQIYAYPFVPPRVARSLEAAHRYRELCGGCLFCNILQLEIADAERIVATTPNFVAFVPEAARWPYEVHIYPMRHLPDLPSLTALERAELAVLHAEVLTRLDGVFGVAMPYIQAWSQAPVRSDPDLAHLRLEIFSARRAPGKLKHLAGSEAAAGVFINDVLPEQSARQLRDAGTPPPGALVAIGASKHRFTRSCG